MNNNTHKISSIFPTGKAITESDEQEIIKKALSDYLSREPTTEDLNHVSKSIERGKPNEYIVLFKNEPIGRIIKSVIGGNKKIDFVNV